MQADVVLGMWKALSDRDWEKVKTFLAEDCIYVDMPVGPTAAARGPEDIVKRLKVGLEPLAGYRNHDGLLVSDGEHVMYEHSETWNWASGEARCCSSSRCTGFVTEKSCSGRTWDFGGLLNHAPPDWMEQLATADTSWIFDATGLI